MEGLIASGMVHGIDREIAIIQLMNSLEGYAHQEPFLICVLIATLSLIGADYYLHDVRDLFGCVVQRVLPEGIELFFERKSQRVGLSMEDRECYREWAAELAMFRKNPDGQ